MPPATRRRRVYVDGRNVPHTFSCGRSAGTGCQADLSVCGLAGAIQNRSSMPNSVYRPRPSKSNIENLQAEGVNLTNHNTLLVNVIDKAAVTIDHTCRSGLRLHLETCTVVLPHAPQRPSTGHHSASNRRVSATSPYDLIRLIGGSMLPSSDRST